MRVYQTVVHISREPTNVGFKISYKIFEYWNTNNDVKINGEAFWFIEFINLTFKMF